MNTVTRMNLILPVQGKFAMYHCVLLETVPKKNSCVFTTDGCDLHSSLYGDLHRPDA